MKPFYLFLVLALAICFSCTTVYAQDNGNQNPVTIIVTTNNPTGQIPRTPCIIPISGYVFADSIFVVFSDNIGIVSVCLEDSLCGMLLSIAVDSSDGIAIIPFSTAPGDYSITFILEDGTSYLGRFELE